MKFDQDSSNICSYFSLKVLRQAAEFSEPRILFAAENKVVMYTSFCKLSWCCYCDVSLCCCDIRYHGNMQSCISVKQ